MSLKKLSLGDLCIITKGTTGIQKAVPGEYPMVVTGEERKSHNEYQFDDEAVIVPLVSGTGHGHASIKRIHYQAGKFALGSILCAIIPKDKTVLNTEYLFRFLDLNRENELVARMKGMANVSLPIKEIAKIEIPIPDLNEQIRFVKQYKILEQSSWKINTELNHQLDLVKQLRQSFLREAIQGKLAIRQSSSEENRETGQQLLDKIKAEKELLIMEKKQKKERELPPIKPEEIPFEIPEDWVWCRLGEVCNIGPRNKAEDSADAAFIPMPLISATYNETPRFDIKKWGTIKSGFTHFADNDVVVAKITPCFENSKSGIVRDLPNGIGAGTTELYVIRGSEKVLPEYIYILVKTSEFIANGEKTMRGVSGQQRVPPSYIPHYLLPLPPTAMQQMIVEKVDALIHTCDLLEARIKQSQQRNDQLLQQILREALQAETNGQNKEDVKIIRLPVLQAEEDFYYQKRKSLATYIVNQSLSDPWLGDTKLMKLLHLADYHAIKRNLGQKFYQKAAGPFDNGFIYPFFEEIERDGWFKRVKKDGRFYFSPGANHNQSLQMDAYFSEEELGAVDQIIAYFNKDNYERPEIVSTLYAVWNNRIINGVEVSDALLKHDFLQWDGQKIKYQFRLSNELQWMKDKGVVPDGWGRLIEKPRNNRDVV